MNLCRAGNAYKKCLNYRWSPSSKNVRSLHQIVLKCGWNMTQIHVPLEGPGHFNQKAGSQKCWSWNLDCWMITLMSNLESWCHRYQATGMGAHWAPQYAPMDPKSKRVLFSIKPSIYHCGFFDSSNKHAECICMYNLSLFLSGPSTGPSVYTAVLIYIRYMIIW